MGGLIARSYLVGKQPGTEIFNPPPDSLVRKLVLIATPNFGSFQATHLGVQAPEMLGGSQFLWDLATWNQGRDDMRGVDALAIIGNAGRERGSATVGDGVVALTSASLGVCRTKSTDAHCALLSHLSRPPLRPCNGLRRRERNC